MRARCGVHICVLGLQSREKGLNELDEFKDAKGLEKGRVSFGKKVYNLYDRGNRGKERRGKGRGRKRVGRRKLKLGGWGRRGVGGGRGIKGGTRRGLRFPAIRG